MKSPWLVVLLAVALGAALWSLWSARGQVDATKAERDHLTTVAAAYQDSTRQARAALDSTARLVGVYADSFAGLRARVHLRPGTVPGSGAVAVIAGDTVEHPLPPQIVQILRLCDSIVPACQLGMKQAAAALTFADARADAADSALRLWEAAPPKKPRFGFQTGLFVGIVLVLTTLLILH